VGDKTIMILFLFSLIVAIAFLKKIITSGVSALLSLITMLAGIIFWFINAPDPRFGFGFILGFISIIAYLLLKEREVSIGKNVLKTLIVISTFITLTYTTYRFKNFFTSDQLLTPAGIPVSQYKTFDCDGININSPVNSEFGVIPIPCTDLDCQNFSPRGNKIEDGFKAK
jgi:hypothetical protein